jgi:hypothetical protein
MLSIVIAGCGGSGQPETQLPTVGTSGSDSALPRDPRIVAVVGDNAGALASSITEARANGKLPLYVDVSGPRGGIDFSAFAPIFRTKHGLVVLAYSKAFVFPLRDVSVRYSVRSAPIDVTMLPLINLPKVDRGVARYHRLKARDTLSRQYPAKSRQKRQSACPDCALVQRVKKNNAFLAQIGSIPKNPWQNQLSGYPVWNGAARVVSMVQPVCDSYGCYYYSYPSFPSGYYGSDPCYGSYSYQSYGGVCGKAGGTPKPKATPTPNPALKECLDIAEQLKDEPYNGMDSWQRDYCAQLDMVSYETRRNCYAVGPLPLSVKKGFCNSNFS